ncbi:helix-turn-helix domain-containing protein [Paracidovorax citrulli]|uniref:helix-turn-helix domain-containing protein n=2 Tax=Paracidovorax citrulli TaxID=80869 RepID=UPI00336ACB73
MRARIVLACAEPSTTNRAVAAALGVSPLTVAKWRRRFAEMGLAGLQDAFRCGAPRVRIVVASIGLRCSEFMKVVGGCVVVVEGLRGGQREALSTASGPVRAAHRPQMHSLAGAFRRRPAAVCFTPGAKSEKPVGTIRTSIQRQSGGQVAATAQRHARRAGA